MRKKVIIFGAGGTGRELYKNIADSPELEVVAFADNFKRGELFGIKVIAPEEINKLEYDFIYIETVAAGVVVEDLKLLGIDATKMVQSVITMRMDPREQFLNNFAEEVYRKGLPGNVAEAGVFRGDFARQINRVFPNRMLYLFDTFEGFDDADVAFEEDYDKNPQKGDYFKDTTVDLVLSKMSNPEKVIIKKGHVPESFAGVEDTFVFVNLDMDLYKPTLEALRWFYPRLEEGGGVLIHDYFDTYSFANLKRGVIEFCDEVGARYFPIGDRLSIFVVK